MSQAAAVNGLRQVVPTDRKSDPPEQWVFATRARFSPDRGEVEARLYYAPCRSGYATDSALRPA